MISGPPGWSDKYFVTSYTLGPPTETAVTLAAVVSGHYIAPPVSELIIDRIAQSIERTCVFVPYDEPAICLCVVLRHTQSRINGNFIENCWQKHDYHHHQRPRTYLHNFRLFIFHWHVPLDSIFVYLDFFKISSDNNVTTVCTYCTCMMHLIIAFDVSLVS